MAEAPSRFGNEIDLDGLPMTVGEYWSVDARDAYSMVNDPATDVGDVR